MSSQPVRYRVILVSYFVEKGKGWLRLGGGGGGGVCHFMVFHLVSLFYSFFPLFNVFYIFMHILTDNMQQIQ